MYRYTRVCMRVCVGNITLTMQMPQINVIHLSCSQYFISESTLNPGQWQQSEQVTTACSQERAPIVEPDKVQTQRSSHGPP